MATQKVHFVNHLVVATLDLSIHKQAQEIALLPKGAELIGLSAEVVSPADSGTLDIGMGGDSSLANDIDLTQKGAHIANVSTTLPKLTKITATPTGANSGEVKVRVLYYLPSTREFEAE